VSFNQLTGGRATHRPDHGVDHPRRVNEAVPGQWLVGPRVVHHDAIPSRVAQKASQFIRTSAGDSGPTTGWDGRHRGVLRGVALGLPFRRP